MTIKPIKELNTAEVKLTGWWGLPADVQAQVLASLPKQDAWTFIVTRKSDQAWYLDLPEAKTFGELLVGGVNTALDLHYADLFNCNAVNGDQMLLTCSITELSDQTTVLSNPVFDKTWEGSATYSEDVFGVKCWLCPFTGILWRMVPEKIYIKLQSV